MEEELYISLLQKRLSGPLTPQEQSSLDDWLAQSPDNQSVAEQVSKTWDLSKGFSQEVELDMDADFERLERRIAQAEEKPAAKVMALKPKRSWLAIAAAILALLVAPFVLRKFLGSEAKMDSFATADAPAQQPMLLADGSKVWLNAHSSLEYFTEDKGKRRCVKLSGEAFFEVAKNPERPFVVETQLGEVTVLGTSFNVRNKPGKPTLEVNVSTGKVRLQPSGSPQHLLLVADETGIYDQQKNTLVKSTGMANNTAAWHTAKLVFDNAELSEVLQQLSVLYGTGLSVENQAVGNCPLTVSFEGATIDAALETIGAILGAKVERDSVGNYKLTGGRCK
jgi:ferric-dicitrate binding protein FerR (iron transport regulator)